MIAIYEASLTVHDRNVGAARALNAENIPQAVWIHHRGDYAEKTAVLVSNSPGHGKGGFTSELADQ